MHHFRNAAVIEDNGKPTNSPHYKYRLTWEMVKLIRSYHTAIWDEELAAFLRKHDKLVTIYASKKEMKKMPVKINGEDFTFPSVSTINSKRLFLKNLPLALLLVANVCMSVIPLQRIL